MSSLSEVVKDHSIIKLFGTMISMPLQCSVSSPDTPARDQDLSKIELITPEEDDGASPQTTEDLKSPTSSGLCESPNIILPSPEKEDSVPKSSISGEQSETTSTQQEKSPKKPDKIIPCPRCNSMDTKFCYFNNYNLNQPRHFCKNCQRYWTAGGTMRNVPVGAGRRKNKSSFASQYRHIVIPESQITSVNANGLHNTALGNGAMVLTFGSDSPICESMASVLNLPEKTQNDVLNGVNVGKKNSTVSYGREDNGSNHLVGGYVTTSTSSEMKANYCLQESMNKTHEGFLPQLQCIPSSPWQHPWNYSLLPPHAVPTGYPLPFYPTPAYLGCALPASLNIACVSTQSSVNNPSPRSASDSSTSRKHSRDGSIISHVNFQKEKPDAENKDSKNDALIPKKPSIHDPTEAANSFIWSTLGIKSGKSNSFNRCLGLFKAIPSKENDRNRHQMVEALSRLQANPAALSRSAAFHEQQA